MRDDAQSPDPASEARSLHDELREKVLQLQMLSEQLPIILWTVDMDLRCTSVWGAGLTGLNLRPGEVVGVTVMEFLNTQDMSEPTVAAHLKAVQGVPSTFEIVLLDRMLDGHVVPHRNAAGEIVGAVGVAMDITERRRTEQRLHESQERYRLITDSVQESIVLLDEEQRIVFANLPAERTFGYPLADLAGRKLSMLLGPGSGSDLDLPHGAPREFAGRRRNGAEIPVEVCVAETAQEGRRVLAAVIRDITERKRAEEALRRNEQVLSDFFDHALVGLNCVGPDGIIVRANAAELALLGYARDEYVGQHISKFHVDHGRLRELMERLAHGEEVRNFEATLRRKDGAERFVQITSNVLWENGAFVHTRCLTLDVTELKEVREQLERLALYDATTGLPNRPHFLDRLDRAWKRADGDAARAFALLFMDVDDLKAVNDTLGHSAGDKLLSEVGQALQRCLRPGDLAARLGGDEFAVLLFGIVRPEDVQAVAERILQELPVVDGTKVTASLGAALSSARYPSAQEMLHAADDAMYCIKRGVKAGVAFAKPSAMMF
ncbi:MAG: PAS domain S-box protein [Planctomycetota bacterium]|nr:PAS domain S-box protein [Planctomycetota bacterium]